MFRVIGADRFWRIYPNCQPHHVSNSVGETRSECQHPENWVQTSENEWHRYIVPFEEMIRVPYTEGALIEVKKIPPEQLSPVAVNVFRVAYAGLFFMLYVVFNLDAYTKKIPVE